MPTPFPTILTNRLKKLPLLAPGSFRRSALYRFKGMKPKVKRCRKAIILAETSFQTRLGALNISFQYLYRDASNYKQHGEAVFTNRTCLPLTDIEAQIRACLKDGKYFIARQVNLEERFFDALYDDDHPWHEYERIEATTLAPFDPDNWSQRQHRRDITEFIADLEQAHKAGWDEMYVRVDVKNLLERQKADLRRKLEN
jgi:hypothetical protein